VRRVVDGSWRLGVHVIVNSRLLLKTVLHKPAQQ
jgi:hypothetical protein